ncbi:MAG: hypothetical protein KBT88_15975 [Gammaproteobacteria bacterium]|nr:hypothetical protein [Gammaproteobacteria bacterium]MBQ0841280.1 hypothetical protein [Gammaproteobacteria bacterium]
MGNFTDEELEQLGVVLPNYCRSLCTKALYLSINNLGEGTKEEFFSNILAFCELLKLDVSPLKTNEINDWASAIQPISQLFKNPTKAEEFLGFANTLIPDDHPIRKLDAYQSTDCSPKAFYAAAIFALIIMMSATEKKMKSDGASDEDVMRRLDAWSEHVRLFHEQLLYFDSELENIKNNQAKRKAAKKSNAGHTELHKKFFAYYAKNSQVWSKAESARRFYRELNDGDQKLYSSEQHAKRQLTEALRKHLKNQ